MKDYSKALDDYSKAIEIDPNYASAYFNTGNTYIVLKEYSKALEDYNRTI